MRDRLVIHQLRNAIAGPIDLALDAGRCLAITGPSGAGKSVFLRMIADLDPSRGDVLLDGRQRASFSAPEWRRQVMYNAAEAGWWHDRVGEHFQTPPLELAERLGLQTAIFDQAIGLCSTGERQRLAILRALVGNPKVFLLDEPTASLDAESTGRVEALLQERLSEGMAIVLVTHDLAQASRLGDEHRIMLSGQLTPT